MSKAIDPNEPEILPCRKYPDRKFCKILKGEHKFEPTGVMSSSWSDKYFITSECLCGKKGWDSKYAEALSPKEKELYHLQTVENGESKKI